MKNGSELQFKFITGFKWGNEKRTPWPWAHGHGRRHQSCAFMSNGAKVCSTGEENKKIQYNRIGNTVE
jgi:hypothetical protein